MKIGRFADAESTFWATVDADAGTVRPLEGLFEAWAPDLTARPGSAPAFAGPERSLEGLRFLAPVRPGAKVVAMGLTYPKHAEALGREMPKQMGAALKTFETLIAHDEEIAYPAICRDLDYEAELVVVVGAPGIATDDPFSSFLGYTIGNDITARDLQYANPGIQDLFSAKAIDGTNPVGPWIVTRDELGAGQPDLDLTLTVEGEVRQHDRTSSMAWDVGEMAAYVDQRTRLHCGDVLFTGTTAGVGREDGRYLQPGQEVVITVEGIGSLRNVIGPRTS